MPSEISFNSQGEAEMMYFGATPWHGHGTALDAPATTAEAINAAHLDWRVEMEPVYRRNQAGQEIVIPNQRAIVRADNGKDLGMVTNKYQTIQNTDAFQFYDEIIGMGDAIIHSAGALRDGKVVYLQAKLKDVQAEIVSGDMVEGYMLLSTSHDGSLALQVRPTLMRVICWNTFQAALSQRRNSSNVVTIRHTGSIHDKAVKAREALGLTKQYFYQVVEGVNRLASRSFGDNQMESFANTLLRRGKEFDDSEKARPHAYTEEDFICLMDLFYNGKGQDLKGVQNTAWAALNAVTEFVDYHQRVGHGGLRDADDRRQQRAWFGKGVSYKERAWNLLHNHTFINGIPSELIAVN